jgi:hypothetical protein
MAPVCRARGRVGGSGFVYASHPLEDAALAAVATLVGALILARGR